MGQSIFNITPSDDHDRLRTYINSECVLDGGWKKYFSGRLKRAGPRTESAVYETVRIRSIHCMDDYNQNTSTNRDVSSTSLNHVGKINNHALISAFNIFIYDRVKSYQS
jgi:hypothetical protein